LECGGREKFRNPLTLTLPPGGEREKNSSEFYVQSSEQIKSTPVSFTSHLREEDMKEVEQEFRGEIGFPNRIWGTGNSPARRLPMSFAILTVRL
jgi:hypothetical protein